MIIELITTGSELMLGRILNTHQQWLCRQLADRGFTVARQVAVPDTAPAIEQALRDALTRADVIMTTGGLGPTADDLTRDAVARVLGKQLHEDTAVLARLENYFASRGRPMPDRTRIQALVPADALVLPNAHGTAPGLGIEFHASKPDSPARTVWLFFMPGPTRELRPMFRDSVVPLLQKAFPDREPFQCRTLRTSGIGESFVQEKLGGALDALKERGLELGYCARSGQVDVRVAASGTHAGTRVSQAEAIVRSRLGNDIFGSDDEELEAVVVRLLTARTETLAVAESCTGGFLANSLTNVSGASQVFSSGWVTYSNESKQHLLGVRAGTLSEHGAVSEAVAREMADGARRIARTDYALSVTGIAGPTGGSESKPVGTVFIALSSAKETRAWKMYNPCDRLTFKQVTSQQALNQLRLLLESNAP